ncbi:hypothetical protein SAY86_010352 [Trapa natans]|uniref:Uncharacterized protein n=1 Tax=Trapa natans TaxID=22666 RepID=A0AAN7LKF2_TRANT|nr:hypothetical protein SAY86_010352 [Trapa natans]
MAEASTFLTVQRYAVVTGANKGIGFGICRLLSANGVTVVLTSRDEKKGLEAVCRLKEELPQGSATVSGEVIFHQLDVTNSASIDSLIEFIRARFGKLDILVNNAGVSGHAIDANAFIRAVERMKSILQLSDSARIVNLSSSLALFKNLGGKPTTDALGDMETLTRDGIDAILKEFLEDFQMGQLEAKGWRGNWTAYSISKAALNAYARLLAKELPSFLVNCVCPGFIKTDMTFGTGLWSPLEGAESPVFLALLPQTGPSGLFFSGKEVVPF